MVLKATCECLTLKLQHSNLGNIRICHLLPVHKAVSAMWTLLKTLLA